jgi:long-chain acyl-CoA synthetase
MIVVTLSFLLSERAKKYSGRVCIKYKDRKLSFSEIDKLVSLTAGGLGSLGLKSSDRAAILMENSPEYIVSFFAILRAGGIAVPVNTFLTTDEISYILQDSGCRILIYGGKYSSHIEKLKRDIPGLKAITFKEIPLLEAEPYSGNSDEVAVLLYTSGTTGFPKGAMLTHSNLISNAEAGVNVINVTHRDKILLFLPLFHSFSLTVCVILPIFSGATIFLLESVKPFSRVVNSIFRDRITLFIAVPTIYNILSKKRMPFFLRLIFKFLINIRACISGAAALPEATVHAFEERFKIPLLEGYGLTETSPIVSVNPLNGVRKPGSVGPPVPGVQVKVVGEDRKDLPPGEMGELAVKGHNVMKGYFNRDEETREALEDNWLYTGDMAKIDEDGYIYIVDRKKDLIIVDGMNIYPREVEDLVMEHDSVEECAMIGVPDGRGSELTVLYMKKAEDAVIDDNEIRAYLKGQLAQFKIPKRIRFIEELPKTATGKIKKAELRKWKL